MKQRLDSYVLQKQYARTRSQAENLIKLGNVEVNGTVIKKSGYQVSQADKVRVHKSQQYVSRAALKLESAMRAHPIDFSKKTVLDVGSSTGGFTDYVLQHGAQKVIAVDVGSNQLHPSLRQDPRIDLHEKTDIRDFKSNLKVDIALIDVSFISILKIIKAVRRLSQPDTIVIAMVKPQFEADGPDQLNNGVVKNSRYRRAILQNFERKIKDYCRIISAVDSAVPGEKGNVERFYTLKFIR